MAAAPDPNHVVIYVGETLEEVERKFIKATLKYFDGDKRRAANELGLSLKTIYNKLHTYERQRRKAPSPKA